jgi:hypothetical protein
VDGILKEIAIGLAVLFLGVAGSVTLFTEAVSRAVGWRAANLWAFIRKAVDGDSNHVKPGKWLVGESATGGGIAGTNAKKIESEIRDLVVRHKRRMNSVPGREFARAAIKVLVEPASGATLTAKATALPVVKITPALQHIIQEAGDSYDDAVTGLNDWFDDQMERLGQLYARNMKFVSFGLGLVLAVVLNLNAIDAFDVLHDDANLRAVGVTAGQQIVEQCLTPAPDTALDPATPPDTVPPAQIDHAADQRECAQKASASFFGSRQLIEAGGLFDGDAHGRPYQTGVWPPLGIVLSAGAISLGAPFWLNALKRLTGK